jgi:hypothetical protein
MNTEQAEALLLDLIVGGYVQRGARVTDRTVDAEGTVHLFISFTPPTSAVNVTLRVEP